jgi:hypothetical protein
MCDIEVLLLSKSIQLTTTNLYSLLLRSLFHAGLRHFLLPCRAVRATTLTKSGKLDKPLNVKIMQERQVCTLFHPAEVSMGFVPLAQG